MYKKYQRILAPVDGSKEAELALKKSIAIALQNDASLIICHVVDTRSIQTSTGYEGILSDELVDQAKSLLADYKKYAEKRGVKEVKTIIDYGLSLIHI